MGAGCLSLATRGARGAVPLGGGTGGVPPDSTLFPLSFQERGPGGEVRIAEAK